MQNNKDVSACVYSITGIRLLKNLISKDFNFKNIYASKEDSQENLTEIRQITSSCSLNLVLLDSSDSINLFEAKSDKVNTSCLLLLWWPYILKKRTINLFDYILNIHPSLLPFGRGKYGYFWSIINSEPFGVTIHLVDEGIDSGRILAQKIISVEDTDTAGELYQKGVEYCILLFDEAIEDVINGLDLAHKHSYNSVNSDGSYHNIKDFKNYCRDLEASQLTVRQAIDYLRARTFKNGSSYRFSSNGKLYECIIDIKEIH